MKEKKTTKAPVTFNPEELQARIASLEVEVERYRTTLLSIGDGVITTDTEGRVRQMNPAAEDITGWTEAEALGMLLAEVFPIVNETTRETVENPITRVLREGSVVGLANHTVLITRTGAEIPIADSGAPIHDSNGAVTGVVLVFRDKTEERGQEEALRLSEEKYRRIIKNLSEGFYSVTVDGKLIDHNREFCRILGFGLDESMIGAQLPDFWQHPEERQLYLAEFKKHGVVKNYPITAKKHTGEMVFVEVNARLVQDTKGKATHIEGTFNDVTARKRAEDALREANETLERQVLARTAELQRVVSYNRGLIEASLDPLITKSPDGKITDVNRATETITGRTKQELIGTDFSDYFTDPEKARALYRKVLAEGFIRDYELQLRHADGHTTPVHYNATVYRDDIGKVIGIFAAARDVTEIKNLEQTIQKKQEELQTIVDSVPAWIFYKDKENRFIRINKTFADVMGMPKEQLEGKSLFDLYPKEQAEAFWKDDIKVMQSGKPKRNIIEPVNIASGILWAQTDKIPYRDAQGTIIGIIGFTLDITQRKLAEDELKKHRDHLEVLVSERTEELADMIKKLERSNKELEQFAYVASHDLQEPLRMVSSYTQLLAKRYHDKLDQDAKDFIEYAVDGANRMQRLIQDLLSYSRITTRAHPDEPFDAHDALGEAVRNLQAAIQETGALITNDELPTVLGDYTQVVQIFQNLIGNGIKFRKPDEPPRIHIHAEQSAERPRFWTFTVSDNGIGIEERHFDRLFVIFQRLHGKQEYPGTGIGLALCKRIVERHGGEIHLTSEPCVGTTFHFTLPSSESTKGVLS